MKRLTGYLWIWAAAVLWGILGPVSRAAFDEGVQPLEVALWRAVLAWMCFAVHAAATRQVRIETRDILPVGVFAVLGVAMFYGAYQLAIRSGGAALASVLLYTAPVWVTIMSRIFFKESITLVKIAAVTMTVAGVAAVGTDGGRMGTGTVTAGVAAIGYGLLAGFCYSAYYIFGKYFSGRYTSPNLFLYMLPVGALCLLPWVTFSHKTPTAWLSLAAVAVISTYGAYFCYYNSLKYLEPSRASVSATLEPVVAAVVAFFWWGEVMGVAGYLGSVMIIASVLVMIGDDLREVKNM
ncbi:MAG: EamA family transporter [Pseudomonadota bacterium]